MKTNPIPTQQETLERCPFCPDGGNPYFTKSVSGSNMAYVGCSQCGVQLKAQVQFLTSREDWTLSKDIVGIWNTRRAGPRRDAWKPIESAPRHGAAILVGHERHGSRLVRWMVSVAKDAPNGWWFVDGYDGPRLVWEPTHWMFVPALDAATASPAPAESTRVEGEQEK